MFWFWSQTLKSFLLYAGNTAHIWLQYIHFIQTSFWFAWQWLNERFSVYFWLDCLKFLSVFHEHTTLTVFVPLLSSTLSFCMLLILAWLLALGEWSKPSYHVSTNQRRAPILPLSGLMPLCSAGTFQSTKQTCVGGWICCQTFLILLLGMAPDYVFIPGAKIPVPRGLLYIYRNSFRCITLLVY